MSAKQYHPPNARTHAKRLRALADLKDELRNLEGDLADAPSDDADHDAEENEEYREHIRLQMATVRAENSSQGDALHRAREAQRAKR